MRRGQVGLLVLVAAAASLGTYAVMRSRETGEAERIAALRAFVAWNPQPTRGGRLTYYCGPFENDGSVDLAGANWECSPVAGDAEAVGSPTVWLKIVDGRAVDYLPSGP